LAVVGLRDGVVDEHEGGAGVGDGGARARVLLLLAADAEAVRAELPETLGRVDGDVGERAGELGTVNVSELVGSGGGVLQVGGEEGLGQGGLDVVEKRLLAGRLDGVEFAESQAEEAVAVHVLREGRAERGGELDRLSGHRRASDVHGVRPHISARATPVAVADAPGGTVDLTEGRRLRRIEGGVASTLLGGQLGVEDPPPDRGSALNDTVNTQRALQVRRARVEVQHQRLAADIDGRQVLGITALRRGWDLPGLPTGLRGRVLQGLRHRPAMLVECSAQSGGSVANMVRAANAVDLEGPAFVRYWRRRGQGTSQQKSDEQQGALDLHLHLGCRWYAIASCNEC